MKHWFYNPKSANWALKNRLYPKNNCFGPDFLREKSPEKAKKSFKIVQILFLIKFQTILNQSKWEIKILLLWRGLKTRNQKFYFFALKSRRGHMIPELLGGGDGTSVDELSKFGSECRWTFCQKWGFFENFRDTSTQITPKITFYCIFINKFPKNFEKSAQKFFAAPSAPKTCRNTPIFSARVWRNNPPPLRGHPPKKNLWYLYPPSPNGETG